MICLIYTMPSDDSTWISVFRNKYFRWGVAIAAVSLPILYFTFRRKNPSKLQLMTISQQTEKISIETELDKLRRQSRRLKKMAEMFTLQLAIQGVLSIDCLKNLLMMGLQCMQKEEIREIVSRNRRARRKQFHEMLRLFMDGSPQAQPEWQTDWPKIIEPKKALTESTQLYYRYVCTFSQQLEYCFDKSLKNFVVFLDIDYDLIATSVDHHQREGKFTDDAAKIQFQNWINEWPERIKDQIKVHLELYDQPIDSRRLNIIMKFQIKKIKQIKKMLLESVASLNLTSEEEKANLVTFLGLFLDDLTYSEFWVEREQLHMGRDQIDQQLNRTIEELSEVQERVLKDLIDSAELSISRIQM